MVTVGHECHQCPGIGQAISFGGFYRYVTPAVVCIAPLPHILHCSVPFLLEAAFLFSRIVQVLYLPQFG